MSSSSFPCDSRVADGAIRGTMVGSLWLLYFLPAEVRFLAAANVGGHKVGLGAARYSALTMCGFAGFFGAYNGVFCGAERLLGEGAASPLLAGGVAGAALGATVGPPASRLASVAICSASTAALCSVSHALVSFWKK